MSELVLVTGGAGFIGSHVVDRLIARGRPVRVLDAIEPQVHSQSAGYRNPSAQYMVGTILDPEMVRVALEGVGAVVHLAAQVGVGQSMYEMTRYVRENSLGTAVLLEALSTRRAELAALVVASSMSIYGEGQYRCGICGTIDAEVVRKPAALLARQWEPACSRCGQQAQPCGTSESHRLRCDSVYAVTKRDHEELALVFGRAYGVRTVALRFFNVYGPRQSLSNPYTGVAAIFSSRLLNGRSPLIFEDGLQSRDFVHVSDIAYAVELAIEKESVRDVALNVGTGRSTTILQIAHLLAQEFGVEVPARVLHRFRHGDIRHCWADISAARAALGYEPKTNLEGGMKDLLRWIRDSAPPAHDRTERSAEELEARGLLV